MRRALRAQRRTIRKEREPIIGSLSLFAGGGCFGAQIGSDVPVRPAPVCIERFGRVVSAWCLRKGWALRISDAIFCESRARSFLAVAERLRAVPVVFGACGVLSAVRFPGIVSSSLRLVWYRFGGLCLSPFIGGSFPAGVMGFGSFWVFRCVRLPGCGFLRNFVFGGCRLFREVPGAVCSRQPPPGSFRVLYDGAFRRSGRIALLHLECRA